MAAAYIKFTPREKDYFTFVLELSPVSLQDTGRFSVKFGWEVCTSSVDSSITRGCSPSWVRNLLESTIK